LGHLVRLIAAGSLANAPLTISSAVPVPAGLVQSFEDPVPSARVVEVVVESDATWLACAPHLRGRVRLVGGDAAALAEAVGGSPDVAIYAGEVTTSGRVEMLTFLHEQAVSITAHRFGNPDRGMQQLPL
jgi:RHH-type proline utilization regulon transcriptional repressor/proline dehydrogenase/delta 1-pyrroline-5-carboxylate dehydrogenase